MDIIELKNVSKFYLTQKLYDNVNFTISSKDKIALLGNNGVGKSTLLKIILEEEITDDGEIIMEEGVTTSYFDQFGKIDMEKKVEELLDIPFEKVIRIQAELEEVGSKFSDSDIDMEALMEKYALLNDEFESLGGYSYMHIQAEFSEVFGFSDKLQRKFSELSGGEKQYIRLAITLFSQSNLVILDEPLSFFDQKKTAWLTNFINKSDKGFIIISHNTDFIRNFANKILNINNYSVNFYECDYNTYLKEKKAKALEDRRINKSKDESIEDTIIAYEKKSILIEKAFDKHAQAVILRRMERELEKLEDEKIVLSPDYKYEYVAPPEEVFIKSREVEGDILKLSNVSKIFEDKALYKDVNLAIHSDSKICIVGENGSGKSTLLRIMLGQEEPTSGEVFINETAKITYIAQETYFENEKISVFDYLSEKIGLSPDFIETAIDSLFNHEKEFRDKRIFMLSGGEKKRLEIFANILSDTDLLIIDEPSTYMDDYSRTTIASMLLAYDGAVILVSHDKFLMRQLDFETYDIRDRLFRKKIIG